MSYYEFIQPLFIALKNKVMLSFSSVSYFFEKLMYKMHSFTPCVAKQPASVLIIIEITLISLFALDF